MEQGNLVELETFDHRIITARLVEIRGRTAVVCSEREWVTAEREHREPVTVGWPRSALRGRVQVEKEKPRH